MMHIRSGVWCATFLCGVTAAEDPTSWIYLRSFERYTQWVLASEWDWCQDCFNTPEAQLYILAKTKI